MLKSNPRSRFVPPELSVPPAVVSPSMPLMRMRVKVGPSPRTVTCRPSPASRAIETPGNSLQRFREIQIGEVGDVLRHDAVDGTGLAALELERAAERLAKAADDDLVRVVALRAAPAGATRPHATDARTSPTKHTASAARLDVYASERFCTSGRPPAARIATGIISLCCLPVSFRYYAAAWRGASAVWRLASRHAAGRAAVPLPGGKLLNFFPFSAFHRRARRHPSAADAGDVRQREIAAARRRAVTPPVGQNATSGNTVANARSAPRRRRLSAGKNFKSA